jgi:hypothetical protein
MNKMQKVTLVALLASLPALPTAYAQTFDWTETGSPYGDGAGTLTLGVEYPYDGYLTYNLSDFTGYFGSSSPSADVGGSPITSYSDAGLYFSSSAAPGNLARVGIEFESGQSFNIQQPLGPYTSVYVIGPSGYDAGGDTFALDSVPEPPANLCLIAAAGLFVGWRRWRSVRAARA